MENNRGRGRPKSTRKFICNETGEVFSSPTDAANAYGVNKGRVLRILNGEARKTGKYSFKYIE